LKSDHELTALSSIQSHVTKQDEKRRRQRQRRRERKQQKARQQDGSVETPIDEELTTQMQVWAVHEPKQTTPNEGYEAEQIAAVDEVIDSMLASLSEDRIDS
jgi:hypothetical protein